MNIEVKQEQGPNGYTFRSLTRGIHCVFYNHHTSPDYFINGVLCNIRDITPTIVVEFKRKAKHLGWI